MPEYNEVLTSLRKKAGLSQQELANRLGMTRSAISMYETGQREPDLETFEIFADFYNVDMNTLTGHKTINAIAQRIKQRRTELDLSLQDVADMTNMSKSTLQRYESGSIRSIPLQKLGILADALQATPDFILGLTNSPDTRVATQVDIDHFWEKEPPGGWGYTEDEKDMLEKFKRLPLDDRNLIQKIVDYCFDRFIRRENE